MTRRPPRSPLFPSTPLSRPRTVGSASPLPAASCDRDRGVDLPRRPAQNPRSPPLLQGTAAPESRNTAIEPLRGRSGVDDSRSEEHTSELQSQSNLVCRLLLE